MKKSKLSTGLVTSFIAAMSLGACSPSVTNGKGKLVSFTGYNGQSLSVVTDELYDDYLKSSTGISAYYQSVIEVLIRNAFNKDKSGSSTLKGIKKTYDQIVNEAKNNVKGDKQSAKENADTNGTSYKTEWQSILSGKGVKDESELLQYYIYQLEKEVIEDWYFDQHKEQLTKEYLGVGDDGASTASAKASARFPYHIRHILIKAENGAAGFVRETISASQATLLSNTIQALADGRTSFGDIALQYSEDSSNTSYGDVGIMTADASSGKLGMVNEFQLGIYAYDAINYHTALNTGADAKPTILAKGLGLDRKVKDKDGDEWSVENYFDGAIQEIPYSVFVELGDVADLENNEVTGLPVEDGKAAIYPRNLLWNRYLNNHGIFVITNSERGNIVNAGSSGVEEIDVNSGEYYDSETVTLKDGSTKAINYGKDENDNISLQGFNRSNLKVKDGFITGKKKVLADEQGNVIIGVRSEFGIHLMIVQKSIYEFNQTLPTLEQYYTTAVPGSKDGKYPQDADGNDLNTYVNFINTVKTTDYKTRADDVRSKIKGFDSTYDYRLYEDLVAVSGVDRNNETTKEVLELIEDYIALQRTKNEDAQEEGMQEVWQTYVDLLETQKFYRHELERIIPEGCKIAFTKSTLTEAEKAAYEEGGRCYVK